MKSSVERPPFKLRSDRFAPIAAGIFLVLLVASAAWFFLRLGCLLYFGDAMAHLNISRRILDSRTPGYEQIGTVWLPMLHLICLPFVANRWLWRTGLAGTIPVALCFVGAGLLLFVTARITYRTADRRQGDMAAWVVLLCFTLNPNLVYLAVVPMTESVFLVGVAALLYALVRFRQAPCRRWIVTAAAASCWAGLTRYDGWFLLPFAAAAIFAFSRTNRFTNAAVFVALAALAPLYWLLHNRFLWGDALEFYRGPSSAQAIQGAATYPGLHDWPQAAHYFLTATRLTCGWPLCLLGLLGIACAATRQRLFGVAFLLLTPVFYIWSIHSAGTPIFVPSLFPFSYYNTRYGLALLPAIAMATGAIVLLLPERWVKWSPGLVLLAILPWLSVSGPERWVCWKESQVNSEERRKWTAAAVRFLQAHYTPGQGLLMSFGGDLPAILGQAGIPIAEDLHEGNGPPWLLATRRSGVFHPQMWAIARPGDEVDVHLDQAVYRRVEEIRVNDKSAVRIYRRIRFGQ